MEKVIKERLKLIEEKYNVKIIYAVESGSRAWGFESSDSDYDVRFIYVSKPNTYWALRGGRDVIEEMDKDLDLDFAGWDLRKALGLLYKGNPPLLEWLESPIVYIEDAEAVQELKTLSRGYYSVKSAIYHYLHMAQGNYKVYIKDKHMVRLKKYLYVMRPLLACMWIESKGIMAPMQIETTKGMLYNTPVAADFNLLLHKKRNADELGLDIPNNTLNIFIDQKLLHFSKYVETLDNPVKDVEPLDKYLNKYILKYGS